MANLASEVEWGLLCMFISLIQFIAMIKGKNNLKIFSLSLLTFVWSFIATTFVVSSITQKVINTGITYFIIAGFALWLAYTIGGQSESK
jgi:hypothetical protein